MKYLYYGMQDVRHRLHIPANVIRLWVRLDNFKIRTGYEIYAELRRL